jgi:hypothetical protein
MKGILERSILIIRNIDGPLAKNLIKDIEEVLEQPEQPKPEPLSDDEIETLLEPITGWYIDISQYDIDIARAIEKAHGIGE